MSTLPRYLHVCGLLVALLALPQRGAADAPVATSQKASSAASEYRAAVESAVEAYNEHRVPDARRDFERAHALKPSARTWHGLGLCSFELGNFALAAEELQTALDDTRAPLTGPQRDETVAMLHSAQQRLELAALPSAAPVPPASDGQSAPEYALPPVTDPDRDVDHAARSTRWSTRNIVALSVASVGAAALLVGIGYGVRSIRKGSTRDQYCSDDVCSDFAGVRAAGQAVDAGRISTVFWGVGGAALVGAGIVWWTGRSSTREPAPSARLSVGPTELGVRADW